MRGKTLIALFVSVLVCRQATAASIEAEVRNQLEHLTTGRLPGMVVLAARDGKIVFQDAGGWADIENKAPLTTSTPFCIGSITKQFTAAAILRLADEGKLSPDDRLARFFPDFPRAGEITLRHLLNHTSGIHSFTDKPDFLAKVARPIQPADLIASFHSDPPDFAPGTGFHYSNSAYFLLGEIVAKVSGKPFSDCLQEMFFEPLGMRHTEIYQNSAPPAGAVKGYEMKAGKVAPALDWDMSWAGGAGAMVSTVGDLFLWNEALYGGKILKPESFKAMTTATKLPAGVDGLNYGFGLVVSELDCLPMISHSGGLNGWSGDLLRLPGQNCTVVLLTNALPPVPGYEASAVARKIAGRLLEDEIRKLPPPAENRAEDPATYSDFTGRYDYKSAVLTVTTENTRLFAQLTGQPKYEIFPSAKDSFFWKVTDAKVAFIRDDQGKVTAARHTQGGATFTAPRVEESKVRLSETELDAILGRYQYGPNAVLTVTRDGTAVFAQLTGQPKLAIHAKSATEFEWQVVKASVTFVKDAAGKITHAVHSQNGVTFDAPKIK